jgi:membrane-bound lytic murein transglycosylase MltF
MKKFEALSALFKKYAGKYNFDYLMIMAQGYQESLLDQGKRNPSGAVGIMQVIPKNAAASPIEVPNVTTAENNIEAGVKMLRNIEDKYFNDPKLDPVDKTLMVFASYNAGPNRIARLRQQASQQGLDPNKWFGNVELMVAKDVGQETVTYVSNVYKYYIAYKLALENAHAQSRPKESSSSYDRYGFGGAGGAGFGMRKVQDPPNTIVFPSVCASALYSCSYLKFRTRFFAGRM